MKDPRATRERLLSAETKEEPKLERGSGAGDRVVTLTILWHPDGKRIGERAKLPELDHGGEVLLSRASPEFSRPRSSDAFPLADPFLSRKAAKLARIEGGIALTRDGASQQSWTNEQLTQGVVLELGQRVVLLLHDTPLLEDDPPELGFFGENESMHELRRSIERISDMTVPILLRGETGTGKELVAHAIHAASARRDGPIVAVNMAAIAAPVATSELFGHVKGAFTGAVSDHQGYFERASGGTLFLDEIAECPVDIQVMLLRVLETGALRPVGAMKDVEVDVRLIAATDADLEEAVRAGRFRAPLYHRIAGYELHLPPLRDRMDDFGRLFSRFLREELERTGETARLDAQESESPWVLGSVVGRLARYTWPGNVRQLKNVARQLVVANLSKKVMELDRSVERLLMAPPPAQAQKEKIAPRRKPAEVGEDELIETLRKHRFRLEPAAVDLRISRASLYMLIERSKRLRKASDIPKDELEEAFRDAGGDVECMAERLEVSGRGLYLRLRETGVISRS
jgi:two-component system nitrogen regulation response regulator GlnG